MKFAASVTFGAVCCMPAIAEPMSALFVGNSHTFGRVDPVMSCDAANMRDLTKYR